MPSIEELLNGEDTQEDVFAPVSGYKTYEYEDSNIIYVDNKTIGSLSHEIAVSGESDSQYLVFERDRLFKGIDLTTKTLRIHYERPDGAGDNCVPVNVAVSDTRVRYGWIVPAAAVALDGKLKVMPFAIGAAPTGNNYVLKDLYTEWNVHVGLSISGGIVEPGNDWYMQFLDRMEDYVSDARTYANNAKASETAAKTSESAAKDAAETAQEAAREEAEKVQQNLQKEIADLRAYFGMYNEDTIGLQVDYANKTVTRIAGAVNLTEGADFDAFSMYGGRRRCNVADDGTIVAWYGDEDFAEDGSMGQVMVYQPKFYYLVMPVVYDPIDTGIGYHLRKANYYVSEKSRAGFRLHPAFYDANGNEVDYILVSAYEGSIWDADGGEDGTGAYLMNDEQVMSVAADKFCSIARVKPASGLTQSLTRPNLETLAQNRGTEWHGDLIKIESAEQLLMMIELGTMNFQNKIGTGVGTITDNASYNCSSLTGSTSALGNGTGQAAKTVNEIGGTETEYTANGKTAVSWRGKENPYNNIWKFVYGVNIWGNGSMGGGEPYICNDFNFAESKRTDNYEGAGFTVTNAGGYISAMGYSTKCDWLFMASECLGNSSVPVGDYTWVTSNLNAYRIALLGGRWDYGTYGGGFSWILTNGVGSRARNVGGRLVYIPTKDSTVYNAAIDSWKEQMQK